MNLLSPNAEQLVDHLRTMAEHKPSYDDEGCSQILILKNLGKFGNTQSVVDAFHIAWNAHADQKRKFTNEYFIFHPFDVASIVGSLKDSDEDMICASLLHDVLEDTKVTKDMLLGVFNKNVVDMVLDVTTETLVGNRAFRKAKLYEKLLTIRKSSKTIKLADIKSNSKNLGGEMVSRKFSELYLPEQYAKIQSLKEGDKSLYLDVQSMLLQIAEKQGISLILSHNGKHEPDQIKGKKSLKIM